MTRLALILFLLLTYSAVAEQVAVPAPEDVTVCALKLSPEKYDGKLVRVRAGVSLAFEDFGVFDPQCPYYPGSRLRDIWLEYGGDESSPAIYCCGDHSRNSGEIPQENGIRIPLQRDEKLAEFQHRLTAGRKVRPDGGPCYGRECYFYDLNATIIGHFFSIKKTATGDQIAYGHLGCCHLLFIERIEESSATRTQVPAGGIYDCDSEKWNVPERVALKLVEEYRGCRAESCGAVSANILRLGARHWGDPPETVAAWPSGAGDGEAQIASHSPDLLQHYEIELPHENSMAGTSHVGLTLVRTVCTARVKPIPASITISCGSESWKTRDPLKVAESVQATMEIGSDSWRLDFQQVATRELSDRSSEMKVKLSPNLEAPKCETFAIESEDYSECHWVSRDGMQSAEVHMQRYSSLASPTLQKEKIGWTVISGNISTCGPERLN